MENYSFMPRSSHIKRTTLKRKLSSRDFNVEADSKLRRRLPWNIGKRAGSIMNQQIRVGRFGFRKVFAQKLRNSQGSVRLFQMDHLSNKDAELCVQGTTSCEIIWGWYNELPIPILQKFERTGFKSLYDGLPHSTTDKALIHCLAEKWWDTTHTFHFEKMGEMTMTPTDFTAISGLRVGGKVVRFDKCIHKKKKALLKYLGEPITRISQKSIEINAIREAYRGVVCNSSEHEDMLLRAFIIALVGTTIFTNSKNRVRLCYLPMLMEVNDIEQYNWGGAGLAFLYEQMDDMSRCNAKIVNVLCKAWEIWAREYIPATRICQPSNLTPKFPFSLHWKHTEESVMEIGVLMQYYRIKLLDLLQSEVNWKPWGDGQFWPQTLKESEIVTQKRVFMLGPRGGEWYLGERVTIQSIATTSFFEPKPPPTSMLVIDISSFVTEDWALDGKPAIEFVENTDNASYEAFLKNWCTAHVIEEKIKKAGSSATKRNDEDSSQVDDLIPMPPWTLLVPSADGGPNIIRIPQDVGIENLNIPSTVKHISITMARKLLSMIGGMQHVLIQELTSAREIVRDYSVIIQRLKHELNAASTKATDLANIFDGNSKNSTSVYSTDDEFNNESGSTNIRRTT